MNITKKERRQRRAVKSRAQIRALKVARLTVDSHDVPLLGRVVDAGGQRLSLERQECDDARGPRA